ncbi:hypothetical protein PMAYCL1PPCAC_02504 [Pristionchus mayeri]|uniref:Uncharacterized protein n=1 Tax=Pristionchus mayeri TaxID=1317129 RepID=A0AAN4Z2W9_9BILA|nr:hypothetical protein PMAYCL1PPCAC_02504 [Pristionchus mayeri]
MNQQRAEAMRISPQDKLDMMTNNCLFLVRSLRARAYKLHEDIFTSLEEKESGEEMKKRIVPLCIKLNKNYDDLEVNVLRLPDKTALDKGKLERIKYLFQEEQIDTAHSDLIDRLIRATNYNEGNLQFNLYLSTFMQTGRRKNYSMIPHSVSYSKFDVKGNPHAIFEHFLTQCQKEFQSKKSGILINILEKSCYSSVFELRSGNYMQQDRSKAFVCVQKVVVVENGGSIDKVIFYAPNEELLHMDDFGERRIDLRLTSRYEIYRRLSINTNLILINNAPIADIKSMHTTLYWLSKIYLVIESPCRVCKKVLKDFLPPTIFNVQNTRHASHETCR